MGLAYWYMYRLGSFTSKPSVKLGNLRFGLVLGWNWCIVVVPRPSGSISLRGYGKRLFRGVRPDST